MRSSYSFYQAVFGIIYESSQVENITRHSLIGVERSFHLPNLD